MSTPIIAPRNPTKDHDRLKRVTVNLIPRSAEALEDAATITRDSKTDTINRAIQVYAYLAGIITQGGEVLVRDVGSDKLERLRFL